MAEFSRRDMLSAAAGGGVAAAATGAAFLHVAA